MRSSLVWLSLSLPFTGAACGHEASDSHAATTSGPLQAFYVATPPANAKSVLELRSAGKSGDEVVVRGRAKDFVGGLAAFTLVDSSMRACDEEGPMPDCETPWDFCCDPIDEVNKATTSVEIRDASGVVKQGAQGFAGLDHLDTVVAAGKLERDERGNMTVIAKSFSVEKRPKK
jgi:hypothetical protein